MAVDVSKNLERARKYVEKNKLDDAILEYRTALQALPTNQEVMQALGDLHTRKNEPEKAAQYYGMLFDRFVELGSGTRAVALFARFLKSAAQPPERVARYALLLQKQNKHEEAIESYENAAKLYVAQGNEAEALACWEKIAQLDPENPARHVQIGEVGERLGKTDIASRGFLRAGQLAAASGDAGNALRFYERAHHLAPGERSVALVFADALLQKGNAARAVELLEPFSSSETDAEFLKAFGEALLQAGQLDRARGVFDQFYREKADTFEKLFELAGLYAQAGKGETCVEVLKGIKERMFPEKKQNEFATLVERLVEANPKTFPLVEFCGRLYGELNRESKYFDVLVRLFDLYLEAGNVPGACDVLDRLVDIDPYDFRNQERIRVLRGKADPEFVQRLSSRVAAAATGGLSAAPMGGPGETSAPSVSPEARARQALEDLLVQAEIFVQYGMQAKAVERLQKIADMFPGAEEGNERLLLLFEQANWWPAGAKRGKAAPAPAPAPAPAAAAPRVASPSAGMTGAFNADTLRDLAKISEITRQLFRQSTPKVVLSTGVNEVGKYLRVARCLAIVGPPGQAPQMASEYTGPGMPPSGGAHIVKLMAMFGQAAPDDVGALPLEAGAAPVLRDMGLSAALAVPLVDKETQSQAGMLIVGSAEARKWKTNESYFLQAVGDQVLLSFNHTKLRSLMRNLAVADEKTGLLGRGAYQDCLLAEAGRAKSQNSNVSVVILQIDRGTDLVRQHGEATVERHLEQVARALQNSVRQNDLAVKYTALALAYILPDTNLSSGKTLAEKLRKAAGSVRPPWDEAAVTLSGAVVEAVARPDFDSEDIVTDLINRAEFGLEEARKKGDTIVSP